MSSKHRGLHPKDHDNFAESQHAKLLLAVDELSWLMGRGYNEGSALTLVGNQHQLTERQRKAVGRCACSEAGVSSRQKRQLGLQEIRGRPLELDGLNCLITCESALSSGLILRGRDGAHRDMASIHGTYRLVQETPRAIELIGTMLSQAAPSSVLWFLDRPVSNSGRLKSAISKIAADHGWDWQVELDYNPDRRLMETEAVVATADAWILDNCSAWIDLVGEVIEAEGATPMLVDLSKEPGGKPPTVSAASPSTKA